MTDDRDPVEDWLSRDVEVMPPPPGAFQRVRRRARRRKAIQAAAVAAGLAVVIAAGVSVPALTGNLFAGGTGPARIGTSPASPTGTARSGSAEPNRSGSGRSSRGLAGPALSSAGNGHAPPAGFRPTSVTFVGNRGGYLGAVLGRAACGTRAGLCTAMAGTASYGTRWTRIGAPPAAPPAVSQVRFADPADGWAFGPALYATHDGGLNWNATGPADGRVIDLATMGGRVLAVLATGCAGTGPGTASGCTGVALYAAAATGGPFTRVLSAPAGTRAGPGALQLTADRGYLITNGRLYAGPLSGTGWAAVQPRGGTPACLTGPAARGPWLLAPGRSAIYLACGSGRQLALYESADAGRTWRPRGAIPVAGTATSLAVSPAGTLVLATTGGLYYSPGGRIWNPASGGSPAGVAFGYVGMTTASLGVAVPASASRGLIYVTRDGGRTWQASRISR